MAYQQLFLVSDNSSLANFKAWAQPVSDWFRTCGWTNTGDSNQVNWSTIASVPTAPGYVFDIFQPGDAGTAFYVKMEYGNSASTNPTIRMTLGTGTDGSGNLTGYVTNTMWGGPGVSQGNTLFECNMSGGNNRIGLMMWRGNTFTQVFAIERSLDSTGSYTNGSVTGFNCGAQSNYSQVDWQSTIVFGVGVAPQIAGGTNTGGWRSREVGINLLIGSNYNGSLAMDTPTPFIGYYDYPVTMVGRMKYGELLEGISFGCNVYGTSHTYMYSQTGPLSTSASVSQVATCLRID